MGPYDQDRKKDEQARARQAPNEPPGEPARLRQETRREKIGHVTIRRFARRFAPVAIFFARLSRSHCAEMVTLEYSARMAVESKFKGLS
jgi:hypothetical protein